MFYKNVIIIGPGISTWEIIGQKARAVIVLYKTTNNGLHYITGVEADFNHNFYFYNAPSTLKLSSKKTSI